jgi:putative transposase
LYPNKAQAQLLHRNCGCRRYVYNHFLAQQQARYSEHKAGKAERGFISYTEMCKMLTALKAAPDHEWLREVNAHALQQTLKDLETAFKRFFTGKAKYPVFKRKGCRDGFRVPDACAVSEDMRYVWICKFGWVRCRGLRPAVLRPNGNSEFYSVQSVTVRAVADWFEASVLFRVDAVAHEHASPSSSCGLDIGISKPAAVVDDVGAEATYGVAEQERLRRNDIKLRRWQRKLARQQKGSASRQRTKSKVARAQHKASRIRRDYAHKISHKLSTEYHTVVVEDLNIRGMTASAAGTVEAPGQNVKQKSGLNREMLRLAPAQLVTLLEYKCRKAGGRLIRVNPAFTSQTCSACGTVDSKSRENQATFRCVHCGYTGNADFNAARNIRMLGLKTVGATVVEGHLVPAKPKPRGL